ncbi:MAG: sporulation initiation factor Spo0A C-terminal domain-containing protein [Fastidiosipilaceae bacterium]|nr:hypothetical protein [Clostridiaceae bacterium]
MSINKILGCEKTEFFIIANDKDLLAKITNLMSRKGYVGVVDTAGRVHYLLDGRNNPYRLTECISNIAEQLRPKELDHPVELTPGQTAEIVDRILMEYKIPTNLKGYMYLRYGLMLLSSVHEFVNPISKTLYPEIAQKFHAKPNQIDRVIRYATKKAGHNKSNGILIYELYLKLKEETQAYRKRYIEKNGNDVTFNFSELAYEDASDVRVAEPSELNPYDPKNNIPS